MSALIVLTGGLVCLLAMAMCLIVVFLMASRGCRCVKTGFNVWPFAFYIETNDVQPE